MFQKLMGLFGGGRAPAEPMRTEEWLAMLSAHGIRPKPGADIAAIAADAAEVAASLRESGEPFPPMLPFLIAFGGEDYRPLAALQERKARGELRREDMPAPVFWTDDLWHAEFQTIDGPGAYKAIVERLVTLSGGELPLTDVADRVDLDGGRAEIEWTFQGRRERMALAVDEDWVDTAVFGACEDRLISAGSARRIAVHPDGAAGLMIVRTPAEIDAINAATGLAFAWRRDEAA